RRSRAGPPFARLVLDRRAQHPRKFFLDVDNQPRLPELLLEPRVLSLELLDLLLRRRALGLWSALLRRQSLDSATRPVAPISPGGALSVSSRIRALYSAVNVRRLALSGISGSGTTGVRLSAPPRDDEAASLREGSLPSLRFAASSCPSWGTPLPPWTSPCGGSTPTCLPNLFVFTVPLHALVCSLNSGERMSQTMLAQR